MLFPKLSPIGKTVTLLLLLMLVFVVGFVYKINQPRLLSKQDLRNNGAIVFQTARNLAPVNLESHKGEITSIDNFKGKWTLVFPGFTHCPDVCPATLSILSNYWQTLSNFEKRKLQIVLLSLDPSRDTTEKLENYINYFDKDFLALRANLADTYTFATALNIAYTLVNPNEVKGNYTIDHSANIAIINPNGQYQGFIKPPFNPSKLKLIMGTIQYLFD